MSLVSTYARCRNGTLYKNPILVFPEGFLCFDDTDPPELVLWMPKGSAKVPAIEYAQGVLERVLGRAGFDPSSLSRHDLAERVIPGSDPWVFAASHSYFLKLTRRIPRPMVHDGTERHASRLRGCAIFEWDASAEDATSIEIPEKT